MALQGNAILPLHGPLKIKDPKHFLQEQQHFFMNNFEKSSHPVVKLEDFTCLSVLGEGAFGKVILVKHNDHGKTYAMKMMSKKYLVENKCVKFALNEKRVIENLNFPFCIRLELFCQDSENLYLFLPFISAGELYTHMKKFKKFAENHAKFYAAQMVLGLEYLHYCDLVYRDIKPENILLDETGYIKITDFGFTKIIKTRTYTFCGTPEYLAPEIILNAGYGKAVDWWSLGVLIYEMVEGKTPFHDEEEIKIYKNVVSSNFSIPTNFSKNLGNLIDCLLQKDITKRYGNLKGGVDDIKTHAWFRKINWLKLLNRRMMPPYIPQGVDNITNNFPQSQKTRISKLKINEEIPVDYAEYFKEF